MTDRQRRIFRLAFGVTIASSIAMAIDWPLAFLTPILVANFLKGSDAAPTFKAALGIVLIISGGLLTGTLFSGLFMDSPLLAAILLALMFYWIYYLSNLKKLNSFLGLMLIIGITIIPLMWQVKSELAMGVTHGFVLAAIAALGFVYIAHLCFPHQGSLAQPIAPSTDNENVLQYARHNALISTMMVMPAVIYIIGWELSNLALVIAFIAILSLNPDIEQGRKASAGILIGNILGGGIALLFYQFISTTPLLIFYIALTGLFTLILSRQIANSGDKAPLWEMALTNMLVLTGPVLSANGGEVGDKFSDRILQLAFVVIYVLVALRILHTLISLPKEKSLPLNTAER